MRFMVLVPANAESEAGNLSDPEMLAKMMKFNEEMVRAGIMLAGEGLHASSKGARIKFAGGKTSVIDGPFTESKELIAGFWIIQVKSRAEALEWMSRAPFGEGTVLEVRQVLDPADFAPSDPTGELMAKEKELRAMAEARK